MSASAPDDTAEVEAWREERYARLRNPTGWLTLAGLGWLKPGVNRIGSAADADVVLPSGPEVAGTVTVAEGRPVTAEGAFLHGGKPALDLELTSDADGEPTLLELGPLRLCLIDRGGRLAIRTWDTTAAARAEFEGIEHWPVDPAWRLTARLEPTPGRTVDVPDVFGEIEPETSPGDLAFEVEGRTHRLQAVPGDDAGELWLIFGDATNGRETYGGGRYLYADAPDADGSVIVDFNRAYNPPCVFTPYATCPLPWPANRLPIRIEAGERLFQEN
jgi:uncharacterized protein (DUF1684 family)